MLMLLAAFAADLWLGDPAYPYHPVRLMGRAIEWGEAALRTLIRDERRAGMVLALGLPLFVFAAAWTLIALLASVHPALGWAAGCFGIYSSISVHDLRCEALRIYNDLKKGDLPAARGSLSRIVGRETSHLDEPEITRACIESVAENSVDGIVAPLFFAALGGAPLALAYKAVNTLDSMIGHKNERYLNFGFFAARQDHWIHWIPSRLAYGFIALASLFGAVRPLEALRAAKPYVLDPAVGNSPIPEAAYAGALDIQLGGTNLYHGKNVLTPRVGAPKRPLESKLILESLDLMTAEAWVALLFCCILAR